MTRNIKPHDALVLNEWLVGGLGFTGSLAKPSAKLAAGAATVVPRRLWSAVPGRRLVADRLDAWRYAERQDRLRSLGGIVAVATFSQGEPRKQRRSRDERVTSTLRENRMLERGRIVNIQPIIYATAYREGHRSLTSRARALKELIGADKAEGETFSLKPAVINSKRGQASEGVYGATYEAAADLESKVKTLSRGEDDTYVRPPGLVLVMSAELIANTLKGVHYNEVVSSGAAVFGIAGRSPNDTIWMPGSLLLPPPARVPAEEGLAPAADELPAIEAPIPFVRPVPQAVQPYNQVYS